MPAIRHRKAVGVWIPEPLNRATTLGLGGGLGTYDGQMFFSAARTTAFGDSSHWVRTEWDALIVSACVLPCSRALHIWVPTLAT
jgi:hypothetical protein